MKPRIFVSSTFYDLKYVREDLASFIRNYGFDSIMFEEGDIGYEPGKPLDESCYEAMQNSDLAVLIIGGQYGSKASEQDTKATPSENTKTDEYISITRKEFKKAIDNGIPVFAFVDASVHAEYEVFKANIEKINADPDCIKFRAAKDVKVFYFIQEVYKTGNIPVEKFNKISDVKETLAKQWADMMKRHLNQIKEKKEIESINKQLNRLENLVDSISTMVNAVGKKVIKQDEYDEIQLKQKSKEIFQAMRFFTFEIDKSQDKVSDAKKLLNAFIEVQKIPTIIGTGENMQRIPFDNYFELIENTFIQNGFYLLDYSGPDDFNMADLITVITRDLNDEKIFDSVVNEIVKNENSIILYIPESAYNN